MLFNFKTIDEFLFSIEKEIIDLLYDYKLLVKFDLNVKKIIFYVFVKRMSELLVSDKDLLLYHNNLFSESHELFQYFDKDKLITHLNKICKKIQKATNRIFYIKNKITLPNRSLVSELDGSVIDEVVLLKDKKPIDPKNLITFLSSIHLTELYKNLSKKVC